MNFEILAFDSELFGFKVARILTSELTSVQLELLLQQLDQQRVKLVYWQFPQESTVSKVAAETARGSLVSEQITYYIDLSLISPKPIPTDVRSYNGPVSTELTTLAHSIGQLSRFGTDPKMPSTLCEKMYSKWIENAINRSVAQEVFVVHNPSGEPHIVGVITLSQQGSEGKIGLLAVDPHCQKSGIGSSLMQAAQSYLVGADCNCLQVVTQRANRPACHLYEKFGALPQAIDNFYHFWL